MELPTQSSLNIGPRKLSDYPEYFHRLLDCLQTSLSRVSTDPVFLQQQNKLFDHAKANEEAILLSLTEDVFGNLGEESPRILMEHIFTSYGAHYSYEQTFKIIAAHIRQFSIQIDLQARALCVDDLQSLLIEETKHMSDTLNMLSKRFEKVSSPIRSHLVETRDTASLSKTFDIYAAGVRQSMQMICQANKSYGANYNPYHCDYLNDSCSLLCVHASIQSLSTQLWRLASDLRLRATGPRGGFKEIVLPAVAPGSSIMPGKLNPVMAEMVYSTSDQVDANHASMSMAIKSGWLESAASSSIILRNFIESSRLLRRTIRSFTDKCLVGVVPNTEK